MKLNFNINEEFHDACGIGLIAELNCKPGKRVLENAIIALNRMSHRGGDNLGEGNGDGSGLLMDIPEEFFKEILADELNFIPESNEKTGIAMVFTNINESGLIERRFRNLPEVLQIKYLGKRAVPVNKEMLSGNSSDSCPQILQFFFAGKDDGEYDFETRLYLLRKMAEKEIADKNFESFICSCSSRTIVYKGLMKPGQLAEFYTDLLNYKFVIKMAIFHERFSTNTISSWSMAQPFRMLSHNGEINTIKGNRLWMKSREETIKSDFWNDNIESLKPIVSQAGSDSYSLDNLLEFLVMSGKGLFESIMMLIPEPYLEDKHMDKSLKDFYVFYENHLEPWDGPAALVFTNGKIVGAKLDRNGLRPLRYTITKDGLLIMASEAGVIDIKPENILVQHHMKSGENFAFSLDGRGIISNLEIIKEVARNGLYSRLLNDNLIYLERGNNFEEFGEFKIPETGFDQRLRVAFGFDQDDLDKFLIPMAENSESSLFSTGDDTPTAFISNINRRFYDYFYQAFAQVTNPPIDPLREKYTMSLNEFIGNEASLLSETDLFNGSIRIESPVLSPREVKYLKSKSEIFSAIEIYCKFKIYEKIEERLNVINQESEKAVNEGNRLIFLTDEGISETLPAIPMLLVISSVHQHLVKKKLRNRVALICFTGDIVEEHHLACLTGFGASAVYPYMAYELIREKYNSIDASDKMSNYRNALEKGLLKIMAKMGVSTLAGYRGSMLFHSIGLSEELIYKFFPSVKSAFGNLNLDTLKNQITEQYKQAFGQELKLRSRGRYNNIKNGEIHGFNTEQVRYIQQLADGKVVSEPEKVYPVYIRDFLDFKKNYSIDIKYVESAENILKRFGFGAVSYGAISDEAHRTLARAAFELGIRSNTGEGGEQKDRHSITNSDQSENCHTKQIASGRFGVTTYYLTVAKELQIKMAQGAKPGEGGQLPAAKVSADIAKTRYTTPGVLLISPPPHHDIYSIEDLAQLIYDLRQVNPLATICIKLVSQFGIGIVASGAVKAGADVILISGGDGGTGASPSGSIKHAGLPWETGLLEVHNVLIENNLRERVILRVDGGLKTSDDIILATLLGAEEFDFGTSALIAMGCVMCRKCHLDSCSAGIATQNEELRKKFKGTTESIRNYMYYIAEEVRKNLSEMGYSSLDEIIGKYSLLSKNTNFLNIKNQNGVEPAGYINITYKNKVYNKPAGSTKIIKARKTQHIDQSVIEEIKPLLSTQQVVNTTRLVNNTNRAIGTRLSGFMAFLYGEDAYRGLIKYNVIGSAGQSFGAFLVNNIELNLTGVANDFVAKGMTGGTISVKFPDEIRGDMEGNTIIGNVALYGATGGELFVAGKAGERFAVRNSGALAVVEGTGNNCCEYMTKGKVIILGEIGRNFGAGMTGGETLIYNERMNTVIENLNDDYLVFSSLNPEEEDELHNTIEKHFKFTNSIKAYNILNKWVIEKNNFIKLFPKTDGINKVRLNKNIQN